MNKCAWLFLCFVVCIDARENPFETTKAPSAVGKMTQIQEDRTNFTSVPLTLPSSARILKSVSVAFQNLDGSISEEVVAIDQNINWHEPLILTRKVDENKTTAKQNTTISLPLSTPETTKQSEKKSYKETQAKIDASFKLNDTISFNIVTNEIKIVTKDKKVRDFLITEPYKIVVDFMKESSFETKTINFQKAPFVSATIGNHDGFYRIAILLDGQYRYNVESVEGGYLIKLK